ncbi:hypothetical protein [Bacillus sp. MUM 13]|uniref:hypothetical protein n=1 Tax=Bacillus sp. MUM 13 TaxID=1678001 RepID=UPI0008F55AB3|nr:hypothetical protein [Bacillus sp. MUM 13]OIK09666.1 hypothetical protein BIV59_16570 [Bacillus sp. MUM 13]
MAAADNKEIKDMVELLLKQQMEKKIQKREVEDKNKQGQTIINIDNGTAAYALLYLLLQEDVNIPGKNSDDNAAASQKLKELMHSISQIQKENRGFYNKILQYLETAEEN